MFRRALGRFLNVCVIGITAVLFFALAHGFKWI
jgi:hypothetical protein